MIKPGDKENMKFEESKQTDEQVSQQLIVKEFQQLRNDLQQLSQQPRFDWKWFLSLAMPLVVPFIAAGIIGYFGIKADLKIIQRDMQHVQSDIAEIKVDFKSDIAEIKADLKETNKRIDAVEKGLQSIERKQIEIIGNIQLLNQKFDTIGKRIVNIEKKL